MKVKESSENWQHCNHLQGNYGVELLHREIPVVITGNEFTEYNFFGYISFPVLSTLKLLLYTDRNNLVKLAIQVA